VYKNFLRNLIVNKFCKSVYICQSYDQKSSVFFTHSVVFVCILNDAKFSTDIK